MPDQATHLRRLAVQAGVKPPARHEGPPTLVISGGRPGVGATTLAAHLAASLAQEALRVVLVDADLYRADIASLCHLSGGLGIGDVLAGRKTIHEALQRGPAGMQVLAGTASAETRTALSERANQRLFRQIKTLRPHADWLIIDAGNQPSDFAARLWSAADRLMIVTSPDAVAVMDSYALVKTLLSGPAIPPPLDLVVNHAPDALNAADVHRRIDQSCRRFLALGVAFAGHLPHEERMPRSLRRATGATTGPLVEAVGRLATRLVGAEHSAPRRAAA